VLGQLEWATLEGEGWRWGVIEEGTMGEGGKKWEKRG